MLASANVRADDKFWAGANPFSSSFTDPLNWQAFLVAGPTDRAVFSEPFSANDPVFDSGTTTINQLLISSEGGQAWSFLGSTGGEALHVNNDVTLLDGGQGAGLTANGVDIYALTTSISSNTFLRVTGSTTYQSFVNVTGTGTFQVDSGNTLRGGISYAGSSLSPVNGLLDATSLNVTGSGSINVLNGGNLFLEGNCAISTGRVYIQSTGTVSIPTNATLSVSNNGALGFFSGEVLPNGTNLNITTGGQVGAGGSFLDVGFGNTGSVSVDGANSAMGAGGASDWGFGPAGSATVSFSHSAYGVYNDLRIGQSQGSAQVQILSSASLETGSGLLVGGAGSHGTLSININGGTLQSDGTALFQNAALVNFVAGGLIFSGDGTFAAGSTLNWSGGNLSVASGKTLTFSGGAGTLGVGTGLSNGATVHMTNGAVINGAYLDIGSTLDGGANGTLLIDGAGTKYTSSTAYTDLGLNAGDSGTMTISSIGAASFNAGLHLAGSGGKALLTVSSAGVLNAAGLISGSSTVGSAATINISGGTLNSTGTSVFQSGSAVTLSNGGLVLGDNATFSTGSNFNWTGGVLAIASGKTLTFDGGTGTLGVGSGLGNGATIHITNAAHVTNSTFLDFGSTGDGGANGTLLIDGAGSNYTTTAPAISFTDFGRNPGDFGTLTISNSGAGTFTVLHLAGNGGKALVTLSSGSLNIGTLLQAGSAISTSVATININGGTLNVQGAATVSGNSFVNYQSGSFSATGGITTSNTASISVASGAVVRTGGLTMNDTSLINLNGGLIVDYTGGTPISTIRGYLLVGRNGGLGGLWKGTGISSSTAAGNSTKFAVGYADANTIGSPTTFMGQSIDNTSVLVRLSYNGDANLDGKVNALDFNALATNFGKTPGSDVWTQGDFNYDGSVNTSDFTMLAGNFNATPLSDPPVLGTLVPEPATIASLVALGALLRRRRA
jgi:hypothetical protein